MICYECSLVSMGKEGVFVSVLHLYGLDHMSHMGLTHHEFDIMAANQSPVLAREKARINPEKYCLIANYHRKKIGNDNKWTYVLVPMATLDILLNECTADTDLCTSKTTRDSILEIKTDIMVMFMKELNAIKELQEKNT